jgi:hypothetical protein
MILVLIKYAKHILIVSIVLNLHRKRINICNNNYKNYHSILINHHKNLKI